MHIRIKRVVKETTCRFNVLPLRWPNLVPSYHTNQIIPRILAFLKLADTAFGFVAPSSAADPPHHPRTKHSSQELDTCPKFRTCYIICVLLTHASFELSKALFVLFGSTLTLKQPQQGLLFVNKTLMYAMMRVATRNFDVIIPCSFTHSRHLFGAATHCKAPNPCPDGEFSLRSVAAFDQTS